MQKDFKGITHYLFLTQMIMLKELMIYTGNTYQKENTILTEDYIIMLLMI